MPTSPFNPINNRGNDANNDQVALFIDWDNLVISNYADRGANRPNIEVIVQKAQQYGTLVIARAYAEWTVMLDRLEVYKAGVEPIYAPVFHSQNDLSGQTGKGKSLADPVMVTDCIDFLHLLPQVGTYVLVTGDKDMMPVVRLAKLRGRRVVVIGPDYVANVLQQVCDEFVPYRLLLAAATPVDPYAAYYQQYGYPVPPQPGYYQQTPVQPIPQSTNERESRRGRRPGDRRRTTAPSQPYKDVTMPSTAGNVPAQPSYGGYYPPYGYATPQQPGVPQPGYPAPNNPYPAPGQQYPMSGQYPSAYPAQPQPGYPAQPQSSYPVAPETAAPQSYQVPPTPVAPQTQPAAYTQPTPTPAPLAQPVKAGSGSGVAQPTVTPAATPERSGTTANFEEVKEVIRQIMQSKAAGRGQMRARDLKEELLRRIPNFNERRYGYSKFKALLNAVEQAGILRIDQSGHILWVTLPGTAPELSDYEEVDAATELGADTAVDEVEDDDEEEDEDEDEVATVLAHAGLEPALPSSEPAYNLIPLPGVDTPEEDVADAPFDAAVEAPVQDEAYLAPSSVATERVTRIEPTGEVVPGSAEEAPAQPEAALAPATSTKPSGKATERIPGLGARPMLLEQPYFEDVIVLVEGLRHRNRWLGYELLLSSVRDYLTRQMPESEAKSQAGGILSKLLNEGVLKMAMEVHSRGARKMRVQVAHLQEEHPAVRYALAAAARAAETPVGAPTETEQPQPEAALSMPDAQTLGAIDQVVEGEAAPALVADEGGVPVITTMPETQAQPEGQPQAEYQAEAGQPEAALAAPEGEALPSVEPQAEAAPFIELQPEQAQAHYGEQPYQEAHGGHEQFQGEGQPEVEVQTQPGLATAEGEALEVQGETGQIQPGMPNAPEWEQASESSTSAESGETAPVVEPQAEAGDLGHEATPVQVVAPVEPEQQHTPQPAAPEHQPQPATPEPQFEPARVQHPEGEPAHEPQPAMPEYEPQVAPHAEEAQAISGEAVNPTIVETPGTEGETGQHVQGEPEHAPSGEEPAPAGGFINTVEMNAAAVENAAEGNHTEDGAENEAEGEEEGEEATPETQSPGVPRRPRRRRTIRVAHPPTEGQAESMSQPREKRQQNACHLPPRRPNRGH